MWQAGVPAAGFSASSVGSARPHFIDMRFVHLGIHYNARDLAGRLPVSAQASPLTEVMVVHQSSPVRVPGLSVRGAGTMASAEELEQLIAHLRRNSYVQRLVQ